MPDVTLNELREAEFALRNAGQSGDVAAMLRAAQDYQITKLKLDAAQARDVLSAARDLLDRAMGLLTEQASTETSEATPRSEAHARKVEGVSVFRRYKGNRYEGVLLPNGELRWNGVTYGAPSPAAMAITGTQINGWKWWKFNDPKFGERDISSLR
jgi:acyl-CoA reductase-like NAD-dependent aldehyde dehydrogenase